MRECPLTPGNADSVLDAVVHVRDAALSLEDPGALQLDLLGGEALEQTAPLAEQHRDDVELELVEDTGGKSELCGSGAMDEHVLVTADCLARVIAVVTSCT